MALQFAVGEQPIEPLVLTLTNDDGSVINLTGIDSVTLEGEGLPAGTTSVSSAVNGRIAYTFTSPFVYAGIVLVRAKLMEGSSVDYTGYIELEVTNATEPSIAIVTTGQVETMTGQAVSRQDIARAQFLVGIVVGVDVGDSEWYALQSAWDKHWLSQAVAYQASMERSNPDAVKAATFTSATVGDVSVTYRDGATNTSGIVLAPLAQMALSRLSWRKRRSIQARPFLGNQPNVYTNENAFMWPVVRTDLPPYEQTWRLV